MFAYYTDRFLGGTFVQFYSPPIYLGGSKTFSCNIPSGATIRQAYLLGVHLGDANENLTVQLTGASTFNHSFSSATRISTSFATVWGTAYHHAIDITSTISPTTTSYTITVPNQAGGVTDRYTGFRLFIAFEKGGSDVCDTVIFLNTESMVADTHSFNFPLVQPIDNTVPVAMGLITDYICNNTTNGSGTHDAEDILVNSTNIGHIGSTTGDGSCGLSSFKSPNGSYMWYNSTLTALGDCNANEAVSGLDALSDIKGRVNNGDSAFQLDCNSNATGNTTNNIYGIILTYHDTVIPPVYECDAPAPSTMIVSNITSTTADVAWGGCGGGTRSNTVQWRVAGQPTWTTDTVNNTNTYTITGLTTLTNYEWQVVNIDCSGAVCAPSVIKTFTTI